MTEDDGIDQWFDELPDDDDDSQIDALHVFRREPGGHLGDLSGVDLSCRNRYPCSSSLPSRLFVYHGRFCQGW